MIDFTLEEVHAFVSAFVSLVRHRGWSRVLVAGDLRESTPAILDKVVRSFQGLGWEVWTGGGVPTPALAWGCATYGVPGVMVTGSHIPADRNGLKFYFPEGEILKSDEEAILKLYSEIKGAVNAIPQHAHPVQVRDLAALFSDRYTENFPAQSLAGLRIGFYSHSSAGRDLFPQILRMLGAEVVEFGRSEVFVPVDTEAVESIDDLHQNLLRHSLQVVVSTDGDADRPLVLCEDGRVVPGEILGLITSKFLGVETVVYPVSCSSVLQDSGWIPDCSITRIGSPFVLGRMLERLKEAPSRRVAGFEANGGYLLGSALGGLSPLMTRDSLLPILCFLLSMKSQGWIRSSDMLRPFDGVVNLSGLIKDFPQERSALALLRFREALNGGAEFAGLIGLGALQSLNELDGVRARFDSGITVHLRPSGNAPEFRLYIEAKTRPDAERVLGFFENWIRSL